MEWKGTYQPRLSHLFPYRYLKVETACCYILIKQAVGIYVLLKNAA